MTIGIIVEGQEERKSLAHIVNRISIEGVTIQEPLYASIQPKATPEQIAKAIESRLRILDRVNRILILIDLENLDICPGERAKVLEKAVRKMGYEHVYVVIKHRKFENWLIADYSAIQKLKAFAVTKAFIQKVVGKADNVTDAVTLLSSIKKDKKSFHKTQDGTAIAQKVTPETIAQNSRSFRRFLRLLKHPDYKLQSKKAAI